MKRQQTLVEGAATALRDVFRALPNSATLAHVPWQPFRDGVDICPLYRGAQGMSSALLKYAPGAQVPTHRHAGYEHIFVLQGAQRDERGDYAAGSIVINAPDSTHSVASPEGCIVLVVWELPVEFIATQDLSL